MNLHADSADEEAYTKLHFGVFAALSQLAPTLLASIQQRTQELLGHPVRIDEIKEVMENSREDLKKAFCGISRPRHTNGRVTTSMNTSVEARYMDALNMNLPDLFKDYLQPNDDDILAQVGIPAHTRKHDRAEDDEDKTEDLLTDGEEEIEVSEQRNDASADVEIAESSKRTDDGGLEPKIDEEEQWKDEEDLVTKDEQKLKKKEEIEEQEDIEPEEVDERDEYEEEQQTFVVEEEEKPAVVVEEKPVVIEEKKPFVFEEEKPVIVEEKKKPVVVEEKKKPVVVVEEKAGGDRDPANRTFNLSVETPILHRIYDEPRSPISYDRLGGSSISGYSPDVEEGAGSICASEAPSSPTLVESEATTPAKDEPSFDFAQVGDEPEPWKPVIGEMYSAVITHAKDPSDFYVMKRARFDEDTIATKIRAWWAVMKNHPGVYIKPANVVPGLPVGVIRKADRIERGVVVSLSCDKPSAEVRLIDRGFHEMIAFSRLCYLSKKELIDDYPAAIVRCAVDARPNKFLDDGTPMWPAKVMGSLRKAVESAAPYNAVFYSYDGVKYVANLYIQRYSCEENKSLLFHVIKHLGLEQNSPALSSPGSFAIPAVVQEEAQEVQEAAPKKDETPAANDSTVTSELSDIEDIDLDIENDCHSVTVAATPAVVSAPPTARPFPSCGFPPIRQ